MKLNAIYYCEEREGKTIHAIDHDGGGFAVSSKEVGLAVQNFLNNATTIDIMVLHSHLLNAYRRQWENES